MAINTKCDSCGKELSEFGAILMSPPNRANQSRKFNICKKCYEKIVEGFQ